MRRHVLGFLLLGSIEALGLAQESPLPPVSPPATRPLMVNYAEQIASLWQNLRQQSPSPETRKRVLDSIEKLKSLAHELTPSIAIEAVDPIMLSLNVDLKSQFTRIELAYLAGAHHEAQGLLRQSTQYCAGCHALSAKKYGRDGAFPWPDPQGLSEVELGEYLSASRRHEEAMLAFERALQDRELKVKQPDLWRQAIANLLALTIRIRQEPSITLEMISARLEEGSYSKEQQALLKTWRSSAKAWAAEKQQPQMEPRAVLEKARSLMAAGRKLDQQQSHGGYVDSMRAASLLNGLAASQVPAGLKAEAYLLTGQLSMSLKDVFVWMRPEVYYEACIRLSPHTPLARSCLKAWQAFADGSRPEAADNDSWRQL